MKRQNLCLLLHRSLLTLSTLVTLARAVGILIPSSLVLPLAILLLMTTLPLIQKHTWFIVSILAMACGGLLGMGAPLQTIGRGLDEALIFAAYLSALQILRVILNELPAMARARMAFNRLPPQERTIGTLLFATGIGSILTSGSHALIAPLLPHKASESQRCQMALISLRGICFSAFWSPFAVAVAFGAQSMPETVGILHTSIGLALAAGGFLIAWKMEGGGSFLGGGRALLPILPHCAAAAGISLALLALTAMNPLEAVMVATLLFGIAFFWQIPARPLAAMHQIWHGLARNADELLMIAFALCLGRLIEASPGLIPLALPFIQGLPVLLIVTAVFAGILGGGLIGLHPMITSAIMIGLLRGSGLHPILLIQAIQAAWGFAVTISPMGITLIVAKTMFNVPHQRLVISRNLLFVGLSSLVLILALSWMNTGLSLS